MMRGWQRRAISRMLLCLTVVAAWLSELLSIADRSSHHTVTVALDGALFWAPLKYDIQVRCTDTLARSSTR